MFRSTTKKYDKGHFNQIDDLLFCRYAQQTSRRISHVVLIGYHMTKKTCIFIVILTYNGVAANNSTTTDDPSTNPYHSESDHIDIEAKSLNWKIVAALVAAVTCLITFVGLLYNIGCLKKRGEKQNENENATGNGNPQIIQNYNNINNFQNINNYNFATRQNAQISRC